MLQALLEGKLWKFENKTRSREKGHAKQKKIMSRFKRH